MIYTKVISILTLTIAAQIRTSHSLESIDEMCEDFPIGTRIPHPEDCNLYLKCTRDNGNTFAMVISCQNGVFFNPNSLECDPDYESEICQKPTTKARKTTTSNKGKTSTAGSKTTQTTIGTEETTTEAPTTITTTTSDDDGDDSQIVKCPEQDEDQLKFIKSTDDCSKYFMCYHGRALPLKCWNGLHWSATLMQCAPPEIAKCQSDLDCPSSGKTFLPHESECRFFYYCYNGIKAVQQCGSFDAWDIIERKCKRRTKSICYSEVEAQQQTNQS